MGAPRVSQKPSDVMIQQYDTHRKICGICFKHNEVNSAVLVDLTGGVRKGWRVNSTTLQRIFVTYLSWYLTMQIVLVLTGFEISIFEISGLRPSTMESNRTSFIMLTLIAWLKQHFHVSNLTLCDSVVEEGIIFVLFWPNGWRTYLLLQCLCPLLLPWFLIN